jgi:pSer/pThr/pTyr-binding forkhead associated (FHA) protein
MPKLQVSLPDGTETTHELGENEITIGRIEENMLQIEDGSVSSRHAILTLRGDDYILTDIGSTNGTRLNGQDLAPDAEHPLRDGDQIRFGHVETVYLSENAAAAQPLPAEETVTTAPASSSARPQNFANASPFQSKKKKSNPAGMAIMGLSVVALLAFGYAVSLIFGMKSPL